MATIWTIPILVEELMRVFPNLGRQIALYLRQTGEEETTLMQIGVLHQIQERSITASELAKQRRVSLQSASVLVQGLVERGWVIRVPDPHDRRQFILQITDEGVAKAETTRRQIVSYLSTVLATLTAEEIAAAQIFLPALSRIFTTDNPLPDKSRELQEEHTPL